MNTSWLDRVEYPFKSNYFTLNDHQLHYIDVGSGDPVLFVHGTPSWSFDFRNVIKAVSQHCRCIALDHIGFGLSDKPDHYDYSIQNHSKTLQEFMLSLDLRNITLVVHDFGGPIGLSMAQKYPDRIKRIVVLNSWLWNTEQSPSFKKLRPVLKSPLLPFLYRFLNFSPRFLLPASFGDRKLTHSLRKQFYKPFSKPSERNGTLAFARSLLLDQDWFESLWKNREVIQNKPTLLIWGMNDKFISPEFLTKFQSGFTNTRVEHLATCGHFPQEEEPAIVSKAILDFIWG